MVRVQFFQMCIVANIKPFMFPSLVLIFYRACIHRYIYAATGLHLQQQRRNEKKDKTGTSHQRIIRPPLDAHDRKYSALLTDLAPPLYLWCRTALETPRIASRIATAGEGRGGQRSKTNTVALPCSEYCIVALARPTYIKRKITEIYLCDLA